MPHGNGYHTGGYGEGSGHRRHDVRRLQVTEWTRDTISAEMRTLVGGTSYLHIAINDGAPDRAQIISITKSLIAKPDEWVTEVLTIANDPALPQGQSPRG